MTGPGFSSGPTLPEVIRRSAGAFGDKPALVIGGVSYKHVLRDRLAGSPASG